MSIVGNAQQIKQKLLRLSKDKIKEVENFVDFIYLKTNDNKKRKTKKMEGIWKGMGIENIDIEKEIYKIRKESMVAMEKRIKKWSY